MKIAIVGASGEVGRMIISCLEDFQIPCSQLDLYASSKSKGQTLFYQDSPVIIKELLPESLTQSYDCVFFAAGAGVSRSFAPLAVKHSKLVIDNSSAFREDRSFPLVVPEINGHLLKDYQGLVSNPNCSTIQMVLPLAVLHKAYTLRKVIVSTYQAVSGSGHQGVETLKEQRAGSMDKGIYSEIIDLNVIPQIGVFLDDGYSTEEHKMRNETRRILEDETIAVSATTVRVPVYYGHSNSVYAEFAKPIDLKNAAKLLSEALAINFKENSYLTPLNLASSNEAHVSRLRPGADEHALCFWNVGHNVRIGAAANAVSILKAYLKLNGRIDEL